MVCVCPVSTFCQKKRSNLSVYLSIFFFLFFYWSSAVARSSTTDAFVVKTLQISTQYCVSNNITAWHEWQLSHSDKTIMVRSKLQTVITQVMFH